MKYVIQYEHLEDELVINEKTKWHFDMVKECANEHRLELSDEEFKGFFKIHISGKDISWLMHKMSVYKLSFADSLISYITY
ncbi:hypothetical protein J2Z23_004191 [Lederbergia galactosidilyticus]|uniref:hypothetical protein n=1 Tax=Lederbergia galactosidilytica TaxID=217031 RepID=UPI001AE1678E|nr:hypothetical protein [Lederbergia galactosidilytica]MBP1917206.1 hypothetical protein [Lederbergia galactosidilytica]